MKKLVVTAAVLATCAANAFAGSYNKLTMSAKIALSRTCDSTTCTETVKAKSVTELEVEATPEQIAAFNGDTVFNVNSMVLGMSFKLSDDPNYTPGATSVNVTKTLPETSIKQNVVMSWTDATIGLKLTIAGKGSSSSAHNSGGPIIITSIAPPEGKGNKDHSPSLGITFSATNGDTTLFSHNAFIIADVKTLEAEDYKGGVDTSKGRTQIQIKSKGYQDMPVIPPFPF